MEPIRILATPACLAQEAEKRRHLIKTPDRISERPPRGGLSFSDQRSRSETWLMYAHGTTRTSRHVRFSNRPFGVKHFQTIHLCSVDVARGLLLLFGIGTWALPSWDSKTRRNNLLGGLAIRRTAGPSGQTNSPHPCLLYTSDAADDLTRVDL